MSVLLRSVTGVVHIERVHAVRRSQRERRIVAFRTRGLPHTRRATPRPRDPGYQIPARRMEVESEVNRQLGDERESGYLAIFH